MREPEELGCAPTTTFWLPLVSPFPAANPIRVEVEKLTVAPPPADEPTAVFPVPRILEVSAVYPIAVFRPYRFVAVCRVKYPRAVFLVVLTPLCID